MAKEKRSDREDIEIMRNLLNLA